MALTDFSTLSTAQKKVWSNKVWREGRDQAFWFVNGFMGRDTGDATKPVHYVTELTKTERGDTCIMQIVLDLLNDGVVGDNELEGAEENLVNDSITIHTDQLRHGVKSKGRMAEQKIIVRFREQSQDKLAFWLADSLDELGFLTASGVTYTHKTNLGLRAANSQWPSLAFAADVTAPSTNRAIYVNSTNTATIAATDTITWNSVHDANAKAKRKRIKPIRINGQSFYALIVCPEQLRDLKKDDDYKNAVSRAGVRGPDNPLFRGAVVVVDGIMIFESNKVITTQGLASGSKWGAASTVDGAQALLLGAQALGFARIGEAAWEESDNTDYGNKQGIAYGRIIGFIKPKFQSTVDGDSEDFSVISIYSAAAP